ncbi:MAG: nucleoside-diphosphate sugar epimerase/dehydratase [Actinomycetota bacterium]
MTANARGSHISSIGPRIVNMRRWIKSAALPVHRHSIAQLVVDALLVALAYYLSYRLRFDRGISQQYSNLLWDTILPVVGLSLVVFALSGMYRKWWRYFGHRDYEVVVRGVILSTLAMVGYIALIKPITIEAKGSGVTALSAPIGVVALFFLLQVGLLGGARFAARAITERPSRGFRPAKGAHAVLIVGAGDGGRMVLREILRNPNLGYRPIGFIDDDPRKRGLIVDNGIKVLGATADLARVLDEVGPDEVLLAIPSAPGELRGRVVAACRDRSIAVRTLPTVFELLQGEGDVMRQVREVRVEDMLGREPVRMEVARVGAYLNGEVVMVTGAGGSIGSELCRQISRVGPQRLIVVDHAEDNLFEIYRELEEDRHVRGVVPVLADCKEESRMREVFAEHRPTVVFHAAAYKHVGMMELNPVEAVRNNALATRIVAGVAGDAGVSAFVLVSTDKAVAPATVMGASKALAEWAVQAATTRHPATRYATVRFGNVLGSSGSVVPIFRRQIAAGGPVTITDPQMTRYFMTIPEAVQLIIRSGSLGHGGEVFVLEMGEPVRIIDLAKDMIRLCGLEPDVDIAVQIVGRRPGEKLHEELFNTYERPQPTPAEKLLLAEREPLDPAWVEEAFAEVNALVEAGDASALAVKVQQLSDARMTVAVRPAP